MVEEVKLK
jgi:predicted  nucleic acid-binding Zn-ribbon protein